MANGKQLSSIDRIWFDAYFGIRDIQAEGEAEAELAFLNRTGVIDAILTDDVDAFVFGAKTVIRKCATLVSPACFDVINVGSV